MALPTTALRAGIAYVRRNPLSLLSAARQAARMRLTVPLDLVRWGLGKVPAGKVSDFSISSDAPGIAISATVNVMGNRLRVSGVVDLDEITIAPETLRIELRVRGLAVDALDGAAGPLKAMLAAVDLTKPGNLMGFLPKKPALLLESRDDRFVLDLMKVEKLAGNPGLRRVLGLVAPLLSIRDIATRGDDLLIGLRVRPSGLPTALATLR